MPEIGGFTTVHSGNKQKETMHLEFKHFEFENQGKSYLFCLLGNM